MKFEEARNILPDNNYSEKDYLNALRDLLPNGDIWGFEIKENYGSENNYNDNVSNPNIHIDNIPDQAIQVFRDNSITSVSSNYTSSRIGTLLSVIAKEIKRFCDSVYDSYSELVPSLSNLFLTRWEKLTNEFPYPDDTVEYRKHRVHHKIDEDYLHNINNTYYVTMVKKWFDIDIEILQIEEDSGQAFYVSENGTPYPEHGIGSRVGDRLNDENLFSLNYILIDGSYTEEKINRMKEWIEIYKPAHIDYIYIGD